MKGINQEYQVTYFGHSSWMVTTKNYSLIFDYGNIPYVKETKIDFETLLTKKVVLFFSHDHFDHFDQELLDLSQHYSNVISILGDFESDASNSYKMAPHDRMSLDGLEIFTAASTDAGVCYLIKADGLSIYFSGDNADWGDGDEANKIYYQEIDYIASLINGPASIVFVPVCKLSGQRPSDMTKGAIYAIEKLDAQVSFPMHCNNNESLLKDFAHDYIKAGLTNKIVCMEKKGDVYSRNLSFKS